MILFHYASIIPITVFIFLTIIIFMNDVKIKKHANYLKNIVLLQNFYKYLQKIRLVSFIDIVTNYKRA